MNGMKRALLGLTAGLALAAGGASFAQSGGTSALKGHNSKAPIDVSADRAEAQTRADRAVFAGNVLVKQDALTLRTQRLTIAYSNAGGIDINRIDASGGVVMTSPSETARGDFAVYDLDRSLITVIGNVRLDRGGNYLNGQRLTIDLNTGRATMGGGGRVSGRFLPSQRN